MAKQSVTIEITKTCKAILKEKNKKVKVIDNSTRIDDPSRKTLDNMFGHRLVSLEGIAVKAATALLMLAVDSQQSALIALLLKEITVGLLVSSSGVVDQVETGEKPDDSIPLDDNAHSPETSLKGRVIALTGKFSNQTKSEIIEICSRLGEMILLQLLDRNHVVGFVFFTRRNSF